MSDLKTNYKDDVLNTEVNERRKYQMIQNDDGTVSFVDVTDYSQVGDSFGAVDINATNEKCNEINNSLSGLREIKNLKIDSGTTVNRYFENTLGIIVVSDASNGAEISSAYIVNFDSTGICRISVTLGEGSSAPILNNYTGIVNNPSGRNITVNFISLSA